LGRKLASRQLAEQNLQLQRAQRLAGISRLAGGLAHDFNNLLTPILGLSEMLLEELGPDHPLREEVSEVHSAAGRAAELTRQLSALGGETANGTRVVEPAALLRGLAGILRKAIGPGIEVTVDGKDGVGCVEADEAAMEQAVLTAAIRARDAVSRPGRVRLRLRKARLGARFTDPRGNRVRGRYVVLSVTDSRAPVRPAPAVDAEAPEPDPTLAGIIVLMQRSGGFAEVREHNGVRNELRLYFRSARTSAGAEPPEDRSRVRGGTETVLVVDDSEEVRRLSVRALQSLGYTTWEAANAEEAVSLCERHDTLLHLVLTDVVLPGLSGPDLVERLHRTQPALRALYTTGCTPERLAAYGVSRSLAPVLHKPFTKDAVARWVREVLEAGSRPEENARPRRTRGLRRRRPEAGLEASRADNAQRT
jgi:two-component system, cell cycle sensor histidine kinase and response regulator CckA